MKIKVIKNKYYIKVYIDSILHLNIDRDKLIGLQSYILDDNSARYKIEFNLSDCTIVSEYDKLNKWKQILKEIDKVCF